MNRKQLIISTLALVIIALPFVLKPFIVSGVSMEPTFSEGEYLLVENFSPRLFGLSRGANVIFRDPRHPQHPLIIKRAIGLPNEDVTVGQNNVTVTDSRGHATTFGPDTVIGRDLEGAEFFHVKLGPEDYFLMGDNRDQSEDSRSWGTIQPHEMIGRPVARIWPLSRFAIFP